MFEAAGTGGIDGLFACPGPLAALAVCAGRAYLVDVGHPERTATIPLDPVTQVRAAGTGLIVLASFDKLAAIGPSGPSWTSERLCLDCLGIVSTTDRPIEFLGDFLDGAEAFTITASMGQLEHGRRLLDAWPGM